MKDQSLIDDALNELKAKLEEVKSLDSLKAFAAELEELIHALNTQQEEEDAIIIPLLKIQSIKNRIFN